jgi:uncharacterized LabA/DUF88 family protein
VLFVDGSNWYHGCKRAGLKDPSRIDFSKVAKKLLGPRIWIASRYYVGRVPSLGNLDLARRQQEFVTRQQSLDGRFTIHYGRIEARPMRNLAAAELRRYLAALPVRIDPTVYRRLSEIAARHETTELMVEKAVDVQIAMDLVLMAERNEYDAAYLLSADGDLTPAVEFVRTKAKKIFVASASSGARLAAACDSFIPLRLEWFDDVMESPGGPSGRR